MSDFFQRQIILSSYLSYFVDIFILLLLCRPNICLRVSTFLFVDRNTCPVIISHAQLPFLKVSFFSLNLCVSCGLGFVVIFNSQMRKMQISLNNDDHNLRFLDQFRFFSFLPFSLFSTVSLEGVISLLFYFPYFSND